MAATPPLTFEKSGASFTQSYDKLVIAVGAYSQSEFMVMAWYVGRKLTRNRQAFNVPGVKKHAHFLKDVRYLTCNPLYHPVSKVLFRFQRCAEDQDTNSGMFRTSKSAYSFRRRSEKFTQFLYCWYVICQWVTWHRSSSFTLVLRPIQVAVPLALNLQPNYMTCCTAIWNDITLR